MDSVGAAEADYYIVDVIDLWKDSYGDRLIRAYIIAVVILIYNILY